MSNVQLFEGNCDPDGALVYDGVSNLFLEEVDYLTETATPSERRPIVAAAHATLSLLLVSEDSSDLFKVFVKDDEESNLVPWSVEEALNSKWIELGADEPIFVTAGSAHGKKEVVLGGAIEEVAALVATLSQNDSVRLIARSRFEELTGDMLAVPSGGGRNARPATYAALVAQAFAPCESQSETSRDEVPKTRCVPSLTGVTLEIWPQGVAGNAMGVRLIENVDSDRSTSLTLTINSGEHTFAVEIDEYGYGAFTLPGDLSSIAVLDPNQTDIAFA